MYEKHIRSLVLLIPVIIVVILSFNTGAFSKTIYKWTDKNGQIHLTDDPPPPGKAEHLDKVEYSETKAGEILSNTERSITSYLDELKLMFDQYRYDKHAQSRYLKQVPITRYTDLTMTDIIGPECDMFDKALDVVGLHTFIVLSCIISLLHLFLALCFYLIILKIGSANARLAFIPAINIFPLIKVSGKPTWWGLFLVVPFAGIFPPFVVNSYIQLFFVMIFFLGVALFTIAWMNIGNRLGLNKWTGLLILVPFAQIMLPAYIALRRHGHHDKSKHLKKTSRELYLRLLSSRKIGFETGSISTSRGPVAFKLERFMQGKSHPCLKLKVRMIHLPNFILEPKMFCKFVIKKVLNINGDNVHYKEHYHEKITGNELYFIEVLNPFVHFEAVRDVWLLKGITMKDIKTITGEFCLRLPLDIQLLDFNLNDLEREEYTNTVRVILKDMRTNYVSLAFKGPIVNYITTLVFDSRGRPLLNEERSFEKIDHNDYVIKEFFKGKVARIKTVIADGFLEERYPFELIL